MNPIPVFGKLYNPRLQVGVIIYLDFMLAADDDADTHNDSVLSGRPLIWAIFAFAEAEGLSSPRGAFSVASARLSFIRQD